MRAKHAHRAHFSFGKDAGLIFAVKKLSKRWRNIAPSRHVCAQHARRRMLVRFAFSVSYFAFCILFAAPVRADDTSVYVPRADESVPVGISADRAQHWQQGTYDVWLLEGNARITQGSAQVTGPSAVVWIDDDSALENPPADAKPDDPKPPTLVVAYVERNESEPVKLQASAEAGRMESVEWFGRFVTRSRVDLNLPTAGAEPAEKPPIVARGLARFGPSPDSPSISRRLPSTIDSNVVPASASDEPALARRLPATAAAASVATSSSAVGGDVRRLPQIDSGLRTAQLPQIPSSTLSPPQTVPAPEGTLPPLNSFRRVRFFPRAEGAGPSIESVTTPTGEKAGILSGGVNIVIEGLSSQGVPEAFGPLGDIDIETDRIVVWGIDVNNLGGEAQSQNLPLQIYMEGNIVFRQGDRTIYADRMYYDVTRQVGIILNAELLTPIPQVDEYQYQGLVRLRASAIRQLDNARFVAQDGLVTTSRLEEPSYSFSAQTLTFENNQRPAVDPAGQPFVAHDTRVQSENNYLYVAGVPIFYWPTFSTNLQKPTYYIDNFRLGNDNVFGFQALLELDAFQLLGTEAPEGVEWDLNLDYLSERGFGFGTGVEYGRDTFFNIVGPTTGRADAWFIDDHGNDNLGRDRRDIVPEEKFRGRVFWNHKQHLIGGLLDDWQVQAEVGFISDRTFLEQYYETEWDQNPDQFTGLRLKRTYDNQSFSIEGNARLNDFFTQTQWLPRADHYWLGEPLLDDRVTWFEHTSVGYANIGVASTPTNPVLASQFERLPWEEDSAGNPISGKGERLITRHEFDLPLDLSPFKVVPFALGELGHWGEDIDGDDIQRAYVNAGVRASIPFWAADPTIRDPLFNLNGLAHKVVFDGEVSFTEASENVESFPLYDQLDDDSIEDFRRRLFFSPFGGELAGVYYVPGAPSFIDQKFDPRYHAIRSGLQNWVTSPSMEVVEDLAAVRLGMRHRLQTKRGPSDNLRIIDWLTLDSNATWFPDADRDNAGAQFGMLDYDLRWHLGDRFSILSDGYADTFGDGLRTASIGMLLNRPARGNAYFGFRTFGGIIDANVINATINYRTSPKWILSANTSIDLGNSGNVNQSLGATRIGESLNVTVGGYFDESKDNLGISFLAEPRFLPRSNLSRKTGIEVAPAGAYGLE